MAPSRGLSPARVLAGAEHAAAERPRGGALSPCPRVMKTALCGGSSVLPVHRRVYCPYDALW
jgi:hypothetical protein